MYVPRDEQQRAKKLRYIIDTCMQSSEERTNLYDQRRRYFLYGTLGTGAYGQQRVRYNRLRSHIDLVASFLYAADKCRFTLSGGANADDGTMEKMKAVQEDWNDEFRDTGLAYEYMDALQWSLVFDSMLIKMGWNEARDDLSPRLVMPHSFGVFDESEPDLEAQEAFCHRYTITWENAVLRLIRAGRADLIPRLTPTDAATPPAFPPVISNMIINATGGANLGGPVLGSVNPNYEVQATYDPKPSGPKVEFDEVWVWDDGAKDYCSFIVAQPDIVIDDSREIIAATMAKADGEDHLHYASKTNLFVPTEHPFTHICPYTMPDYFWGESHCDVLAPLQKWTNQRLDEIAEILEMQVDPAKVFSGFMGLTDEKAGALGGPGTWVVDQLPGAKVDRMMPEMPEDLFREVEAIGRLFLEASGLTETVMGHGDPGIRGGRHAKQAATTGSSRIRKTAVGLEPSLIRAADLALKLKRSKDEQRLRTQQGTEFVLAQVEPNWKMRVAGHSHSPLFSDESRDLAAILFKAQAIDKEELVRALHPPNEREIIHSLRKREKARAKMLKENPQLAVALAKGGKGKGGQQQGLAA